MAVETLIKKLKRINNTIKGIEENIESIVSMVDINATKCKLDYANDDLMKMSDVFLQQLEDDDLNDEVEICIDKCIRLKCELDLKHNGQEPSEKKKEVNLHVKMPKLELPTFNGRLESWLSFKDLFFSAIGSNSQIPDIEKLQYLKGQLRGEALRLVNAFPITADNYVEVWQTLLTRYDNPKDLIFTQIDKALRLPKLADDNHNSMFKLLDSCNEITCRALIDSGSQANFISGQCRKRQGREYVTLHSQISGISGHFASHSYGLVEFEFTPHFKSDELFKVNALVLDKSTNNLPTLTCPKSLLAHLKTMPLADPDYNISAPIDILIGAELAMTLFTGESFIGDEEQLTATSSKLGWLLSGRVSSKGSRRSIRNIIQSHHACLENQNIVEKIWKLESIPDVTAISKDENESEIHFVETHGMDSTGRYVVQLPFRNDCHLGDSRSNAIKRLCSLERSLIPRPEVYDQYRSFIKEYLELGHMSLVPKEDIIKGRYYLPHHPVIKEKSCTTKLRVVFDASAKTDSGLSLNDALIPGPKIQQDLFHIILRFRIHPVAINADIAKMYRQIRISQEDSEFQRIVWRNDPHDKIKDYRLETVTYGTSCAPFLAIRIIKQLALDEQRPFLIKRNMGRKTSTMNAYVALFICFSTRAIHLELISSLTTDALISTIRRFIARRGKPATIHSDNATNFVGAHKIIGKLCHNASKVLMNSEGIQWKFIPPSAPHFGGLWEAGVKSMKYHLKRTMVSALLNFKELTTLLAQIEACLNSRPLCPLFEDPEDLQALTPGHFLIGGSLTALPDEDDIIAMSLPNRWQLIQKLMNHFWTRWSQEYVSQLQQRSKWYKPQPNIKEGYLVLIKNEQQPQLAWKIRRISKVFPGDDARIRVVEVKTANGTYRRPIASLDSGFGRLALLLVLVGPDIYGSLKRSPQDHELGHLVYF
ncbi:hypothetical protein LAZ67_9003720 [Cordylochernes scorpioides]|uniref:Integrase catalytic domain-containing protein n=1 Tax=Cordylochernes scorpioides TaxID=51811 RepID=A0ABY6KVA3_9ARAC|nr:hypothetical protein LAZ67_9003720 [Cordylochernes scorpioides]